MGAEKKRTAAKATLRSNIKAYIQQQIAAGVYQPGDRIIETQLAKELNVSQAPVREAILELSAMGLLEERPYSGSVVRYQTKEDILDTFQIRAFVEEYAARRAAERVTDAQLADMQAVLDEMDANRDLTRFVELDIEFHGLIMDAAGSPSLKRAWTMLRMAEWTYMCAFITKSSLDEMVSQHRTIYQLLAKRDGHSAGAYIFLHIKNFGDEICQYYTAWEQLQKQK